MDQHKHAHAEKTLKCGECGHTWKASTTRWCLGCGGKVIYEQQSQPGLPTTHDIDTVSGTSTRHQIDGA
jgi:hypothetical protein